MNDFFQNETWLASPWAWAMVTGVLALWCLVPRGRLVRWQMAAGGVLGVISVGLLASQMPVIQPVGQAALFWVLAAVSVVSAAAMISMRSPVYSAIWFAMTLLGTSCLFLLLGAQLLAIATIAVYAGAIVVMFLFLIMLAQPEGHEYYDRISWSSPAALISSIAGAAMVLILTAAVAGLADAQPQSAAVAVDDVEAEAAEEETSEEVTADESSAEPAIAAPGHHVATLGGVLFSKYLIAVEIAGTLLLIALVGAIAIIMHGREQERTSNSQSPSVNTGGSA